MSVRLLLLSLVGVALLNCCACFPNGSVAFSCGDMTPVHPPFSSAPSSPPFTVSTSSATYRPGGVLTVTVEAVGNVSSGFQGFLLQARSRQQLVEVWPIGRFININRTLFTALDCRNMKNSTVSQASRTNPKRVQISWEAPSTSSYQEVYFRVSVVQDYRIFWVGLNSSSVKVESSGTQLTVSSLTSVLLFISLLCVSVHR